jgi:hypothetical protein
MMQPTSYAAETLLQLSSVATGPDGTRYEARACGAPMPDGGWQGWIEFVPIAGGNPVRTSRETTQPNRTDTEYWATGLTPVYLDGALARALKEPNRVGIDAPPPQPTIFAAPAPHTSSAGARDSIRDSIIDPFSVYGNGEFHLRKQLGAMAAWHLVNIARDYELTDANLDTLNRMSASELIELIVKSVRSRAGWQSSR